MDGVFRAWNDPGSHPPYHTLMKNELRRTWPVLAKALDALPSPEEEEEEVTVTDAQVEAACSAHATTVGDPATWEWIVRERPDVASLNRKQMRAALEAERKVRP